MADNVEIQGLEFQIVNNSTQAVAGLQNLINTLNRLKTATNGGATGLSKTAQGIRELSNSLKGLNSGDASQKITRLTNALTALSQVGNVKISSSIANQLTAINTALAGLKWTDGDKLTSLANGLRPLSELGKANMTTFINQLSKLPKVIEDLEAADIDKFTQQMTALAAAMKPFADEMQKVSNGFSAFPSKIQKLITSTEKYNASARKATSTTGQFTSGLKALNVAAVAITFRKIGHFIAQAVTESNKYQEDLNLFTVALGQYAAEAQNYAEKVSDVMGIDPAQWLRNQGVFNTLLTGFGDTAERAQLMSQNLTQLGYDISSFFNISIEDAMQKLQSGISGELEPLRRLGYDLSQARLEQTALNLGIKESVANMTQAEKAELRYYAIMTQVTTAQGDMARTLEAPANQLRILQAQLTQAARAIGNIFIPALNAILPYAIAVVQVIREIANALANLAGFKLTEVDYSGVNSAAVGAGSLADNLDDAAGAAKKLKQYTAGFDELNVFAPNTGSGSGAGAGGAGGFDFDLPTYDFLGDAVQTRIGEIKKMIEDTLAEITTIVSGFMLAVGAILVVTGVNIPLGVGLMAAGAVGLAATVGLNWTAMSSELASTLALITGVVGGFLLALGAIMAFSGANLPLGIALMALGGASLVSAAVINWHNSDRHLTDALTTLTGVLAGASLAVGAMLAFTGVATGLGIALMAVGAVTLVSAAALNWNSIPDALASPLSRVGLLVSGATLALGAILAFSGCMPLGIALMAIGATSLVSVMALNWNGLSDEIQNVIAIITTVVSVAFLAIGAALAFSGANIPLGLALLAAGAVTMGTAIMPNWNDLSDNVQQKISMITTVVGGALLAVGAILALSGVALPLGLGLMAAGALSLGAVATLNWDFVVNSIKKVVSVITGILSGALIVLGVLLCLSGAGVGLGLAVLAAGLSLSYAAWTLDDNPITRFVRQMANSIIGLVNGVIDAINDMFHIQFNGLSVMGITLIPAFDIRLVDIPHIPFFEDGGFPNEGQLFIAREAGAEMVGAMGRRTAVANNDQIVEGISAGVSIANDGVIAAIYALLNVVEEKDMSVVIGDNEIGHSYDRYKEKRGRQVSTGVFANAY
nr:MAG TPA: minor tail protein [Caudoviricetes sp.]